MEVPLTEFTAIDLERELYAYGLNKEGTKQERYERLFTARHKLNYPHLRPRRPAISKFGARVQLDDFAEIRVYRQAECDILASKLKWRIEQVRRTEDNESLEYFHPEVLERIDRRKTYMINMEEFVVRKNPYVHKIFTIFVSRTTGEDLTLLYARSMVQLATMEEVDSESVDLSLVSNDKKKGEEVKRKVPEKAIISPENIAKALGYILRELKKKTITNYVGLVCDYTRMHMKVVTELIESSGLQMPPLVDDIRDLQRALRNMFAPTSVRIASLLVTELYTEATYIEQMSTICNKNTTKNKTAVAPLDEFIVRLSDILRDMWKHEEHEKKFISLVCLSNKMVKIYGRHVSRELPPITYEDCAAGAGLLQLMVFDALWCITPELEPEEIYANPTVSSHAS